MRYRITALAIVLVAILLCCVLVACDPQVPDNTDTITITLNKTEIELTVGEKETLTASVSVEGLTVTWVTSNDEIVSVNGGEITANKAGNAEITAKVGDSTAVCRVTVNEAVAKVLPTITIEEGYESLIVFDDNNAPNLLAGISAKDSDGNAIDVVVADDANIDLSKLGEYEVTYRATDSKGVYADCKRMVYVTYFGVKLEDITQKALSEKSSWTYALEEEIRTAEEWNASVVPGHSTNWNRFEGPVDNYLVMHGSDTNGRDAITDEVDDENPNTMLWNKVSVPTSKTIFRIYCSNNPYPDYNNLISKVRLAVYDIEEDKFEVIGDYQKIKAPLNADGNGLDYETIRNATYVDFDLSKYAGKEVVLFIQQDAPAEVYQEEYYQDIGYLEFQIPTLISECRDTLVVYSMSFTKEEQKIDYSTLATDTATSWGIEDTSDYTRWGLRGDIDAKSKWTVLYLNDAEGSLNYANQLGGSLQLISREPSDGHDGAHIVRDAVLMNKVNVGNNDIFEIYVGTDTDNVSVNYRLTFVTDDGVEHHLVPLIEADGYTSLTGGWATIQKSQWVEGVKLTYDVSAFKNETVVILIEQDENAESGDGHCTLWFNKAKFFDQSGSQTESSLEHEIGKFTDIAWKALEEDTSSVWGTDSEDGGAWGMRGDADAVAKWNLFGNQYSGMGIIVLDTTEAIDDDDNRIADNVLVNKVKIAEDASTFYIWVGSDWSESTSNVRVSVVAQDGTIHVLSTNYTESGFTALTDGWGSIGISQWVYGTKIGYDISAYAGSTATIVIEHDGVATGRSTLWFVKAEIANA